MNKWETKSYKSNVSKAACDARDGAYFLENITMLDNAKCQCILQDQGHWALMLLHPYFDGIEETRNHCYINNLLESNVNKHDAFDKIHLRKKDLEGVHKIVPKSKGGFQIIKIGNGYFDIKYVKKLLGVLGNVDAFINQKRYGMSLFKNELGLAVIMPLRVVDGTPYYDLSEKVVKTYTSSMGC